MYRPSESWMIRVRTLHIFGTADTAISVGPAKDSAAWAGDYTLELLGSRRSSPTESAESLRDL